MKYIDKSTQASRSAAQRLHNWKGQYRNARGQDFQEICNSEGITSDQVWDLLKDYIGAEYSQIELRQALWHDQKGICCYCGCQLEKTAIEHFLPKEADKFNRTYTYSNLLLSCEGNLYSKKHTIQEGETWESIAEKYQMTLEDLQDKNRDKLLRPKTNLAITLPPKHCDAEKGNKSTPIINPTVLPDCWDRLKYQSNGSITEETEDRLSNATIKVLNLNATPLRDKRKAAWKDADKAYWQDELIAEFNETGNWEGILQRTQSLFEEALNQNGHLCVIYRAYLKAQLS